MTLQRDSLPGIRRMLLLLEHIARSESGVAFSELEQVCPDANASSLSRLLQVMREEELLTKNERLYALGPRARNLGVLLGGNPPPAERVRGCVEMLARETGASAAFFEYTGEAVALMVKREMPEAFHYMAVLGRNANFAHHGFAKVALAYQDEPTRARLLKRLERPLPMPAEELERQLAGIRRDEMLLNRLDDRPGVVRVAAPVFQGRERTFAGVIGVSLFDIGLSDATEERLQREVAHAAQLATNLLGAPGSHAKGQP